MEPGSTFDRSIRAMTEDECLSCLCSRDLGRVAFDVHGRPEILPVNYAMQGRIVIFRTAPGEKLEFVPGAHVAFEADSWDPQAGVGWSVVVKGKAEEVTVEEGRSAEHIRRAAVHPVAPGVRTHWIAIRAAEMTGRHFHVRPPHLPRL